MLIKISLLFLTCILANGVSNDVSHDVSNEVNNEVTSKTSNELTHKKTQGANSTTPVEITINQGGSGESSSFHFDWISLLVEGLAMLTGFVAVWMKIRKERKLQKDKRSKLKGKLNQIYTDVVPSFNSLSESVYKLDATINNNSAYISRNFTRENSRKNLIEQLTDKLTTNNKQPTADELIKEVKTFDNHLEIELEENKKIVTDLYIYEDIIDVVFRYSDQLVVSCFNNLSINESLVEIERIETIVNLVEDYREKLLPHKIYNGIKTVLNYTPIESFQISKNYLDEFFV